MRRAPAYVTSVDRVSPSNTQTPATGHDTSGNKTTSTVREQSNVTASIRTANSAQHSLSGNASQHEPAGRSPAPVSTRMTQANMQGVRSKVNDRSAQRPEQTENAAAQSIDRAVPGRGAEDPVARQCRESHPRPRSAASTRHSLLEWEHVTRSVRLLEASASRNRKQFAPATQEHRPHSLRRPRPLNRHAVQVDEQRILPHLLKSLSPVHGLTGISHRVVMFLLIKHGKPITTRPGRKRDRLGFEMSLRQKECFPLSAPTPQEIERMSLKGR